MKHNPDHNARIAKEVANRNRDSINLIWETFAHLHANGVDVGDAAREELEARGEIADRLTPAELPIPTGVPGLGASSGLGMTKNRARKS